MRFSKILMTLALLTAGTLIGAVSQQMVSADVSSGDRTVLIPIVPCRLTDTRPAPSTVGPRSSPLGAADTYKVEVQHSSTGCAGTIPTDASSLLLNVTAVGASARTFVTIWSDGTRPNASSLNPDTGQPPTPNAVTTKLSATQTFNIYNDSGAVNLIVDVAGYYVNHDHDDRYYTEGEVASEIADAGVSVIVSAGIGVTPNYSFAPERTFDNLTETVTTDRAGYLQISKFFSGSASCTPINTLDRAYYLTVDGVGVASSFINARDGTSQSTRLFGVTDTVLPAGDHVISVGAECFAPQTAQSLSTTIISNASVVVLPG